MPILYAVALLLFSVNILLGFPKIVDLVQTTVSADNLPNRVDATKEQVKGIKKVNLPQSLGTPPPSVSATAVWITDLSSGQPLFVKDPYKQVAVASTTKIMTALVAVTFFTPDQILTVPDLSYATGSAMGLKAGEKITVRSLLYGMLLNSGNDAAFTIAANFPGGVIGFVEEMNSQIDVLGLDSTHFDNPAGFDSPNHYSSASDMAKIAAQALENPQLVRIFSTKEATVLSVDGTNVHYLKNLNKLLNEPGVLGIKTGTTPLAKENLIGLIERDNRQILTVVLGSNDRFGETRELSEWVFSNFSWR